MKDGKPSFQPSYSSHGFTPVEVQSEICKWQVENGGHQRFRDSVSWLEAYQPEIDAYSERLEESDFQDSLQAVLQRRKKKTEKEIRHGRNRYGENYETGWAAFLGSPQEFVKSGILRGFRGLLKSDIFGVGDGHALCLQ